jgi:hypothetical protein
LFTSENSFGGQTAFPDAAMGVFEKHAMSLQLLLSEFWNYEGVINLSQMSSRWTLSELQPFLRINRNNVHKIGVTKFGQLQSFAPAE